MERADVLINKLRDQFDQKASVENMLVTLQLLQSELVQHAGQTNGYSASRVSVIMPNPVTYNMLASTKAPNEYKPVPKPEPAPQPEPDTQEEILPEPQPHPSPRPEPEPMPQPPMVESKPWQHMVTEKNGSTWPIDPVMEVPTLAHQDKTHEKVYYELNESIANAENSLNEKLKEEKVEMGSMLKDSPVRDLKKAISINERHQFINELFRGDETMYERSIKTINGFNIYAEAEYWIQRELKLKVGWDANSEAVKSFDQLVKRRFL